MFLFKSKLKEKLLALENESKFFYRLAREVLNWE